MARYARTLPDGSGSAHLPSCRIGAAVVWKAVRSGTSQRSRLAWSATAKQLQRYPSGPWLLTSGLVVPWRSVPTSGPYPPGDRRLP